jgi:hypothetical protein
MLRELDELRAATPGRSANGRIDPVAAASRSMGPSMSSADATAPSGGFLPEAAYVQDGQVEKGEQEHTRKSARAATLDEEYELLSGKVDDQYQTKVESASKYRMRLSGIVLMNLFSNQGTVDNIDLPTLAFARPAGDSGGNFGATLRQSQLGFEVFGPTVAGAKTRADLQLDLAGGFPSLPNVVANGAKYGESRYWLRRISKPSPWN